MKDKVKNTKPFPKDSWFKILGIGKEGCKIAYELSKKRHYLRNDEVFSIKKEDFICVKGLRNIDELQNYLSDGSVVWYVTSNGKAYQDVLKEVLKVTSPEVEYSLLFSVGEIDKSFAYSLIAKGYINHFIETIGNTHDKILKTIEGLLFILFRFTLIGIDLYDIKLAFSVSPFIKADIIEVPRESIRNPEELERLFKNLKKPISIVLAPIIPRDGTLDEVYKLAAFVKEKFEASLSSSSLDSPSETELFFFSAACYEKAENSNFRVIIFWAEKE